MARLTLAVGLALAIVSGGACQAATEPVTVRRLYAAVEPTPFQFARIAGLTYTTTLVEAEYLFDTPSVVRIRWTLSTLTHETGAVVVRQSTRERSYHQSGRKLTIYAGICLIGVCPDDSGLIDDRSLTLLLEGDPSRVLRLVPSRGSW